MKHPWLILNSFAKGDYNYRRYEQESLNCPTNPMTAYSSPGLARPSRYDTILFLWGWVFEISGEWKCFKATFFLSFADLVLIQAHDYFSHDFLYATNSLLLPILSRWALVSYPPIRMYIIRGHTKGPISIKLNKATLYQILSSHFHLIGITLRTCLKRVGA